MQPTDSKHRVCLVSWSRLCDAQTERTVSTEQFDEVGIRNDFSFLIPDVPVISSESAFIAIHC